MSEKIARLGIERDNDMMYYIKGGDVWATPRKQPGKPKGKAQKVAATGIELDYSKYLYFLDGDGDVARKARALGGGGRRKAKAKGVTKGANGNGTKTTKASRSSISGHYVTEATTKRHPRTTVEETVTRGKKSPEQLDREIAECLAKKHGGNGGNGNGTASVGKPAAKKTKKTKKTKKRR
jgi:hypothetical protein